SVDWSTARRASYRLRQTFRYEYQEPITDLNHRLVMIPPARFGDQRRTYHDLLVELKEIRMQNREDRFGNVVIEVFAPEVQEALAFGAGVCQDYAHVMLALCRECGLPARYVSGHMLGQGGTHAWVEVVLPAGGGHDAVAHAFDPTHAGRAGLGYVTIAVGRDY